MIISTFTYSIPLASFTSELSANWTTTLPIPDPKSKNLSLLLIFKLLINFSIPTGVIVPYVALTFGLLLISFKSLWVFLQLYNYQKFYLIHCVKGLMNYLLPVY